MDFGNEAIIRPNDDLLLIKPLQTNVNAIWALIKIFSYRKWLWKCQPNMSAIHLPLNVLVKRLLDESKLFLIIITVSLSKQVWNNGNLIKTYLKNCIFKNDTVGCHGSINWPIKLWLMIHRSAIWLFSPVKHCIYHTCSESWTDMIAPLFYPCHCYKWDRCVINKRYAHPIIRFICFGLVVQHFWLNLFDLFIGVRLEHFTGHTMVLSPMIKPRRMWTNRLTTNTNHSANDVFSNKKWCNEH